MNGFYQPQRPQFSAEELQMVNMNGQQDAMMQFMGGNMDPRAMVGNQGQDEMMPPPPAEKEIHRSRSFHNSSSFRGTPRSGQSSADMRRSSMMEFGSGNVAHDLDGFQFDPASTPSSGNMQRPDSVIAQRRLNGQSGRRQMSNENLAALNTSYASMPSYGAMQSSPSPYGQTISSVDPMSTFDLSANDLMNNPLLSQLDFTGAPLENVGTGNVTPKASFGSDTYNTAMNPQMQQNMSGSMPGGMHDPGGGGGASDGGARGNEQMMDKSQALPVADQLQNLQVNMHDQASTIPMPNPNPGLPFNAASSSSMPMSGAHGVTAYQPASGAQTETSMAAAPPSQANITFTGPDGSGQQVIPQYRNAYSSSGFDMLGVLMRVATRPKPQIQIGAVDMSCAFVVCDVTQHDLPIVYCSDVFERLTAYTRHEILGRNCRFLQAPDGKIQAGIKRKYVDDQSVLRIKTMITNRQEAQISLINYRKGGQPFMNLLTMIPITWDSDEIKYYVGFQVDLVEQPTSITNKNPDGSYTINYQRGLLPRYVVPEHPNKGSTEMGQTVPKDDVSAVLSTIGSGDTELSKRIWDKVLLENTDDVVHVLSLKGLFLYLSPSSRRVLEYEPSELMGTALSSVCHPSDIVPVTRELKDTSTGSAVNVVFRIRRKHNGYTWFESHGSLHLEQGKGRKCIIMVGRERPVYALARKEISADGGFGESELWTKMSTSGMFLFVSSNVRSLLDRQPEDLIGTSAQALMRQESKLEFGKKLELARTGVKVSFKHDVQHKRGQTLQARTTLYPGDADEGQKPTFLVAQTRLLRLSRSNINRQSSGATDGKPSSPLSSLASSQQTSNTATSAKPFEPAGITTQAGGPGLVIGSQHEALASEDNVFDELKTTRSTSWQFELRQMEKRNRLLAEELQTLLSNKKKRKRRNGAGNAQKDCANCHTRVTPEWRRGPSGNRDLCNSCGLRWAKENGRVTPRTSSQHSNKSASSPPRSNSQDSNNPAANLTLGQQAQQRQAEQSPHQSPTSPQQQHSTINESITSHSQSTDQYHQQLQQQQQAQQQSPQTQTPQEKRQAAQDARSDSHNAKTRMMQAKPAEGFAGGIPARIVEES